MHKNSGNTVFIINALIFFFQALTKSVYPPLLLPLRNELMLDNASAGLLVTLVFFGYALARYPSGVMADKIGCTKTVLLGSMAMAVSFIAVALSRSFLSIALFTFILGISSGLYVTAGYTLAVLIGTKSRASLATAAFESLGMIAGIISPFMVSFFVLYLNWPTLFIALGIALFGLTLLYGTKQEASQSLEQIQPDEKEQPIPRNKFPGIKEMLVELTRPLCMLREPHIRRFLVWSTLVGGLGAISWTGIHSFIPTFLVEQKGYSYDVANSMFALIAVTGLITKVFIGWLADRFGSRRIMATNLLFSVLFFFALTLTDIHWQLILTLLALGATSLNANTLINAYVLKNMPEHSRGAGFGLFSTAYTVIYSAGPFLTGLLSVSVGLTRAIQISATGAATAMVLVLLSNRFLPVLSKS